MYYIKVDTKPDDCCNCMLSLSKALYKANCLNNNCPIKELKPKEFEWRYDEEKQEYISDNTNCKFNFYWFEGDYEHNESGWAVEVSLIIDGKESFNYDFDLPHVYNEDDAKTSCQNYYNKLFKEIIGE